jgi:hypothetical protein
VESLSRHRCASRKLDCGPCHAYDVGRESSKKKANTNTPATSTGPSRKVGKGMWNRLRWSSRWTGKKKANTYMWKGGPSSARTERHRPPSVGSIGRITGQVAALRERIYCARPPVRQLGRLGGMYLVQWQQIWRAMQSFRLAERQGPRRMQAYRCVLTFVVIAVSVLVGQLILGIQPSIVFALCGATGGTLGIAYRRQRRAGR